MDDLALIPLETLTRWLDDNGVGAGAVTEPSLLTGGTQNILMRFRRGDESLILRRPPRHKRASSDRAMEREATVLGALAGTPVPHPALRGASADPSILGASFFVMDNVPGFAIMENVPDAVMRNNEAGQTLAENTVNALARIRSLDITAAPLAALGRPDGWLEKQVDRWQSQLDSYATVTEWPGPDFPGLDDVTMWLRTHLPAHWTAGLMHGDFHLGNILLSEDNLAITAIIDWELATIGAPMVDLGHLMATWPDPNEPRTRGLSRYPQDFPDRSELARLYAELFPEDAEHITWFYALACFRLASLLEGTYARSLAGKAPADVGARLHLIAQSLIDQATAAIRSISSAH